MVKMNGCAAIDSARLFRLFGRQGGGCRQFPFEKRRLLWWENGEYPDVMAFMKTYRQMESVVEQYNREVREYEQKLKQKEKPAARPPERKSVREQLRHIQAEGKQRTRNRKSFDRER